MKRYIKRIIILSVQTIAPLFFTYFIFAIAVESYKNDSAFRSDIMKDYYQPMISQEQKCENLNTDLYKNYSDTYASYNLMLNQYNGFREGNAVKLTEEYKVFLSGLLEENLALHKKSDKLKNELLSCQQDLYQKYKSIAIITGNYDKLKTIFKNHNNTKNKLNQERVSYIKSKMNGITVDKYYGTINAFFGMNDPDKEQESVKFTDEMLAQYASPLTNMFLFLSSNEKAFLNNEQKTAIEVNSLIEKEISDRYRRSWFSRLLF